MLISGPNPDFFARTFDVASPYGSLIHRDVVMAVRLFSSLCVAAGLFAILALAFPGRLMKFAEWAREKTQSGLTRRRGVICVAVFLVLFSAIAYAGAFRIGFHSDDFAWMESTEKTTQDPGHIFSLSQSHFFRPVTFLYHTVNFNLFRKNPYALHISGVALHGLAALFIFLVALQLSDRVYLAITAALLFAAYPVSSRSVMWISGSEIVFAGLIYLSAFYLFLLYLDRKKLAYYILSLILFIFGVMAKEAVISLALATFLAGFLLSKRASRWSGLPFVVVAVFFIFFQMSVQAGSFLLEENIYSLNTGIMIKNYGGYTWASLIPLGHRMLVLYPFLKGLSLVVLAVLIPVVLVRGSNLLRFLVLWYLILLAPFMAFNLPVQPRYLYLPSFALSILIAWVLGVLYTKVFASSPYRKLVFAAGFCLLITAAFVQIHTAAVKMRYETIQMKEYIEDVQSDPQKMRDLQEGKLPADSPLTYDHLKSALRLKPSL